MTRPLRFVPLIVLLLLVVALGWRLAKPEDTAIKSQLVGQAMPALNLVPATAGMDGINSAKDPSGPHLVNFFASWCVPCIAEAPLLLDLKRKGVPIKGIAVRDRADDVAAFLAAHGNPYEAIGADPDSRAQMLFGASGVPETYVVDAYGVIRAQHVGPLTAADADALRRLWEGLRK